MGKLEIGSMTSMGVDKDIDRLARQLLEMRIKKHMGGGMKHWEMSGIEWLNDMALSLGGDMLQEFIMIDSKSEERAAFKRFGEEIDAHQFLEEILLRGSHENNDFILDNFNTNLRTGCTNINDMQEAGEMVPEYACTPPRAGVHGGQAVQDMDITMNTGVCHEDSKYTNDISDIFVVQADSLVSSPASEDNVQDKQQVQIEKYHPVQDMDLVEGRTAMKKCVGPGIAARVRLLYKEEEMDNNNTGGDKNSEVDEVVTEEVIITRRKRKGQRKEGGIRVASLDGWLTRKRDGSLVDSKRKLFEGETSENKMRKFGN